ncbi:MAG TPA: hypothetical protein DCR93_05455 [Cytophagales bacterium]|nr:hypothetical protein [Cytophagales bacterium]
MKYLLLFFFVLPNMTVAQSWYHRQMEGDVTRIHHVGENFEFAEGTRPTYRKYKTFWVTMGAKLYRLTFLHDGGNGQQQMAFTVIKKGQVVYTTGLVPAALAEAELRAKWPSEFMGYQKFWTIAVAEMEAYRKSRFGLRGKVGVPELMNPRIFLWLGQM